MNSKPKKHKVAGSGDCVYPDCTNSRRTRGLCHSHYQVMRTYVRKSKVTEADLESRGLLMPKGTGQGETNGNAAFLDPNATGDAK